MCGIVGYLGKKDAYSILIEALQKLEYRGYDSAGMAVWCDGKIKVARQKGKVAELRKLCDGTFRGDIGLAHTRWATHGTPSERNAHPHRADDVVVIHNGIVENYVELKEGLRQKGHKFLSDTDTEVIPHLVSEHLKEGQDFVEAVRSALMKMTGAYALGIIREGERTLIAAKKESPLVLGIGDGEFFVASDAPALIGRTNKFIFLEDDDMAVMRDGEIRIMDITGKPVERIVHTINWTGAMAEKGGYKHFMLKEIHEQPRAVSDTLIGRVKEEKGEVWFEELKLPPLSRVKKVWMIACGTSYHSCLIGKNMFARDDQSQFNISIRLPEGSSLAETTKYSEGIARRVRELKGVTNTLNTVGGDSSGSGNSSSIYVKLVDISDRKYSSNDMATRVRSMLKDHPSDIFMSVVAASGIGSGMADIQYYLQGPDIKKLGEYSDKLLQKAKTIPGLGDIDSSLRSGKPEVQLDIDREKAADLGVSVQSVQRALNTLVAGQTASTFNAGDDQYDVVVRAEDRFRGSLDGLDKLTVASTKVGSSVFKDPRSRAIAASTDWRACSKSCWCAASMTCRTAGAASCGPMRMAISV